MNSLGGNKNLDTKIPLEILPNSGVTAGSYGPSADATPGYGATFNVPYLTVDEKGRITAASTKTVTIPASDDTDTLVTQNKSTTNSTYPVLLCPTADASADQGAKTSIFAAGVKVNPSTSTVSATTFSGALSGNASTATTLETARYVDGVSFNGSADIVHYGTCSTAAATAAKTVACTSYALKTGGRILVKFTNTNTASNPTLNVNSTGAKAIYVNGSTVGPYVLQGGTIYEFVYNGTQYDLVNGKASVKYSTTAVSSVPSDLAEGGLIIADA